MCSDAQGVALKACAAHNMSKISAYPLGQINDLVGLNILCLKPNSSIRDLPGYQAP